MALLVQPSLIIPMQRASLTLLEALQPMEAMADCRATPPQEPPDSQAVQEEQQVLAAPEGQVLEGGLLAKIIMEI